MLRAAAARSSIAVGSPFFLRYAPRNAPSAPWNRAALCPRAATSDDTKLREALITELSFQLRENGSYENDSSLRVRADACPWIRGDITNVRRGTETPCGV